MDFAGWDRGYQRSKLALPTYPFQRRRYWMDPPRRKGWGEEGRKAHPLLGMRKALGTGEVIYSQPVGCAYQGWLADHQVFGKIVAPGAFYLAAALASETGPVRLSEGVFARPLVLKDGEESREMQVVIQPGEGARKFAIYSQGAGEEHWTLHVEGKLEGGTAVPAAEEHGGSAKAFEGRAGGGLLRSVRVGGNRVGGSVSRAGAIVGGGRRGSGRSAEASGTGGSGRSDPSGGAGCVSAGGGSGAREGLAGSLCAVSVGRSGVVGERGGALLLRRAAAGGGSGGNAGSGLVGDGRRGTGDRADPGIRGAAGEPGKPAGRGGTGARFVAVRSGMEGAGAGGRVGVAGERGAAGARGGGGPDRGSGTGGGNRRAVGRGDGSGEPGVCAGGPARAWLQRT